MSRIVSLVPLALSAFAVCATTALAEDPGAHRCASIVDDQARLECYDTAFGKPATPRDAKGQAAAVTAAAAPPVTASGGAAKAKEEFGLSEAEKRSRRQEPEDRTASITGQVAKLGRRPTGELVVNLADGQVWSQIESDDSRSRVKVGDTVTIRKASLGSYLLVGPDRIAMRVRRVK